jgi:hypothetical protein
MIALPALPMPELKLELRLRLPSLAARLEHNPRWQAFVMRLESHPAWRSGAARLEAGRAWLIAAFVAAALTLIRDQHHDDSRGGRWFAPLAWHTLLTEILNTTRTAGDGDWSCRTNLFNVWRKHFVLWARFIA